MKLKVTVNGIPYDIEVEVNSLYGDKVRVCVPVREIERS